MRREQRPLESKMWKTDTACGAVHLDLTGSFRAAHPVRLRADRNDSGAPYPMASGGTRRERRDFFALNP